MTTRLICVVLAALGIAATPGLSAAADILIPGKIMVIKPGKIAKFVSKGSFPAPADDPTVAGANLHIFDTVPPGAGDVTYPLPAGSWSGLGNPPGAKGFKYKGSGCKVVLLKPTVIKAVCKESVPFVTPFQGPAGITLTAGTASAYCAEFGGEEKKNDAKLTKRKNAPAPSQCAQVGPAPTATATGTPSGTAAATMTPTATPVPGCPLAAGKYTTTQVSGGSLKVYTFMPFPFPAGGTIVQDIAAASLPDCVHDTVVPFPGGFNAPNFCVPALGYTVSVTQTGCGVGRIDSNGGSDFNILEVSDTSDTQNANCTGPGLPHTCCTGPGMGTCSGACGLPHPAGCAPSSTDGSIRVDITVGNGSADACPGGGTANAIVTVPVHTVTWQDNSAGTFGACPGNGVFNMGTDAIITQFDQVLDFTTDTASHHWADIDGDGCSLAGGGPAAGQPAQTGVCLNFAPNPDTVTTVAVGGFGSTGIPNDGSFSTKLPNTVALTGSFAGDTCASPPTINFGGLATRCIP